MATHYLIDAHNPTILSSEINDVRYPTDGRTEANGNFVVQIPDGIKLTSDPTDLSDLLDKKYAAILAEYPGYTNIIYDDLLDATDISVTLNQRAKLGQRGNIAIGTSGQLTSSSFPLGQTVTQYIVLVEMARWEISNDPTGRVTRTFIEDRITDPGVQISTNGGSDFTTSVNGQLGQIGIGEEGTDLVVRIAPPVDAADVRFLYITSWAFIY